MVTHHRWMVLLIALAVIAGGCSDSGTGPTSSVLRIGSVVSGQITDVSDTARYELDLTDGRGASIFLTVQGSPTIVEVRDDTGRLVAMTNGSDSYGSSPLRPSWNVASSPRRYHVIVRLDTYEQPPGGSSSYEIKVLEQSRLPENVPSLLPFDTPVIGEDVHHSGDIDSFTVVSPQAREINVFVRQTSNNDEALAVTVVQRSYMTDRTFYVSSTDSTFGDRASGRLTLEAGVKYAVFVYGWGFDTIPVPYEVELRTINHDPENGSPAFVPNDTVRGVIDYVGDVDDYDLTATPGTRFNLFAVAGGVDPHSVRVVLGGEYGGQEVDSWAGRGPIAENASGTFIMPASGHLVLSAMDPYSFAYYFVGPYSFIVVPIDPAPEGNAPDLALDSRSDGAIEMLGDVDDFRLTLAQDTTMTIELRRVSSVPGAQIMLTLRNSSDSIVARTLLGGGYPADSVPVATLGTLRLGAGQYRLTVEGYSSASGGFTGGYELVTRTASASSPAPTARPRATAPRSPSPSPTSGPTRR
jgi:hypothetical protein